MYLHLGQNIIIKTNSIIGIFDMDTTTIQKATRNFLYENENSKNIINVSSDLPKSFVICKCFNKYKIFVTSLNSSTLLKRNNTVLIKGEKFTNGIKEK